MLLMDGIIVKTNLAGNSLEPLKEPTLGATAVYDQ